MTVNPVSSAVALQLSYKAHSTGVITPGVEPVYSSDPGAASAQILRRVSSSLNFTRANYKSNEIRPDRNIVDFRLGMNAVSGSINGELSPKTYQDFMAAVVRGSWASGISKTQSDFTSIAASASGSSLTFGSSNWAALGFRVGDLVRLSGASTTGDNSVNYTLLSGLSTATAVVYPAPTDMVADTTITCAVVGRKVLAPQSSLVIPKFAFEHYYADNDLADLFTECRIGSMKINMPSNGIATVEFGVIGRNMTQYPNASAPFFTSPTAALTTTGLTTFGGALLLNGVQVGIITSSDLTVNLNAAAQDAAFTLLTPEIYTGRTDVTGTLNVMFNDNTLRAGFQAETEFQLIMTLTTSTSTGADFISFFMPRIKFTAATVQNSGEQGVPITLPFQALLPTSSTTNDLSPIIIQDSLSA